MTLVRYIHLNPLSGGLVPSMAALRRYPFTGHAALMGATPWPWQSIDDVLGRFGTQAGVARHRYESYLADGLPEVKELPTDLLGGGLLETIQGQAESFRRSGDRALRDTRILGESEFVSRVWEEVEKKEEVRAKLKRKGIGLRGMARRVAKHFGIEQRSLFARDRRPKVSQAKAVLIFIGVEYLGETLVALSRAVQMSPPAASRAKARGAAGALRWRKLLS